MRFFFLGLGLLLLPLAAEIRSFDFAPPSYDKAASAFKLLDAKIVELDTVEGCPFTEISALAYDDTKKKIYALNDRGVLFHCSINIADKSIMDWRCDKAYPLRNAKGKKLKGSDADSEGMTLYGDDLLISFERHPRVVRFSPKGKALETLKLPKPLRKRKAYRGANKMLEALTWHPDYGIVCAPERPLKKETSSLHTLYAKRAKFSFPANGSVTELETTPNGSFIILERDFNPSALQTIITLSRLDPANCHEQKCPTKRLVEMDNYRGWRVDNFEGLCTLGDNRYLMISDDNGNPLQRTILLLFEVNAKR